MALTPNRTIQLSLSANSVVLLAKTTNVVTVLMHDRNTYTGKIWKTNTYTTKSSGADATGRLGGFANLLGVEIHNPVTRGS